MVIGATVFRRGSCAIEDIAGIGKRMPITMSAFVIAGLGLIGVPGTAGFVSKWYLILAALDKGWWWLAFLIVASSLIAVVYIGRVIEAVWFQEPSEALKDVKDPPIEMLAPILIMVIAIVYFGVDAELTAGLATKAADTLLAGLR